MLLPSNDELRLVFAFLSAKDLLALPLVCKQFYGLVSTNQFWETILREHRIIGDCNFHEPFLEKELPSAEYVPFFSYKSNCQAKNTYYSLLKFPTWSCNMLHKHATRKDSRQVVNDSRLTLLPAFVDYQLYPFCNQVFEIEFKVLTGSEWHGFGLFSSQCLESCRKRDIFVLRSIQSSSDYVGHYCTAVPVHFETGYFSNGHICLRRDVHTFKKSFGPGDLIGMRFETLKQGGSKVKYFVNGALELSIDHEFQDNKQTIHIVCNVAVNGAVQLVRACHFTDSDLPRNLKPQTKNKKCQLM